MNTRIESQSTQPAPCAARLRVGVWLLWLLAAVVLGLTFSWYLSPDWVVDIGAFLAWCGLR